MENIMVPLQQKTISDKLLKLNTLGEAVDMSSEEAEHLGAFEESALSEEDAADATQAEAE